MPALAPLLRPVFVCGLTDLFVADAAAALGVPIDEEDMDADVVVGVEVDVEEDVVAVVIDADHVVAERSDLVVLQVSIYSLKKLHVLQICNLVGVGRRSEEDALHINEEVPAIRAIGGAREGSVRLIQI